jgi:hypothetical protein
VASGVTAVASPATEACGCRVFAGTFIDGGIISGRVTKV